MITEATLDDIPDVADLLRDLQALHVAHIPHRFHDAATPDMLRAFLAGAMGNGARILLYRTDGVARGYLMWRVAEQARDVLRHDLRRAQLDHVMVQASWRRRGVARRLVTRFEADIATAGCTGWFSLVHAFNDASAALMRSAGADLAVQGFEKRQTSP